MCGYSMRDGGELIAVGNSRNMTTHFDLLRPDASCESCRDAPKWNELNKIGIKNKNGSFDGDADLCDTEALDERRMVGFFQVPIMSSFYVIFDFSVAHKRTKAKKRDFLLMARTMQSIPLNYIIFQLESRRNSPNTTRHASLIERIQHFKRFYNFLFF